MIKKITMASLMFFASMISLNNLVGQTNPTAQTLPYSQNFSSFNGSSTTYPAGLQGWVVPGSLSASYVTTAPSGNSALSGANNSVNSAGVYDMNGKMGIQCTGSALRGICLALNTTGGTGISLIFDAATQGQLSGGRINELGLQYRIGTSGVFTNIASGTYQNNATSTINSGTSPSNISTFTVTLPVACENQSNVQIRWIIRDVTGSGNRPSFSIDNISATAAVPAITIGNNGSQPVAGFVNIGSSQNILQTFTVNEGNLAATTLTQVTIPLAGNYIGLTDISSAGLKLYTNTSNVFGTATLLSSKSSTAVGIGENVVFNSLNQSIAQNSTRYFWVTADVAGSALSGNTINAGALNAGNFVFSSASVTAAVTAGGAKTFTVIPTTQLSTGFCGGAAASPGEFIWADSLGLPSSTSNDRYRFKLVNGSTTYTWQTTNQWPIFQFYTMPAASFTYNTTYVTSVAWSSDGGSTFGAYGSTCNLTSPVNATTQLSAPYCGSTVSSYPQTIFADNVAGATQYEFRLENASLNYTQTIVKTNSNFNLTQFTGLTNGATYSVTVRTFIYNAWDVYGPVCTVTTPGNLPTTSLMAGSCGITVSSYPQILFATAVSGATQYEYRLENAALSYTQTYAKPQSNFNLAQFTGLVNGTTYSASVRVNYNSTWGPYGSVCNVTTPSSLPTTALSVSNCGIIASSYSQILFADAVSGATQYEYRLENAALSYTQTYAKPQSNFNLTQFTGLTNGTTYSVSVRAYYNNTWGAYGSVCNITTPSSLPTTALQAGYCSFTAPSFSTIIFATAVTGATQYEYLLTNASLGYSQSYAKPQANFNLTQFTGLALNTTYTVQVRVFYNNTWGAYGSNCTVTTPASAMPLMPNTPPSAREMAALNTGEALTGKFDVVLYPNPSKDVFMINLLSYYANDAVAVMVFDATGKLLEKHDTTPVSLATLQLGANYIPGIYNIVISQSGQTKNVKVIKQ